MPWPKGEPRGDGTVDARVRPTEISAALYHDVSVRAARLKMTTRAAMELALNAWLALTDDETQRRLAAMEQAVNEAKSDADAMQRKLNEHQTKGYQ